MKILITDNPNAQTVANKFAPRRLYTRSQAVATDPTDIDDVWLDGDDAETLDKFTGAKKRYFANEIDYTNTETIRTSLASGTDYETPKPKAKTVADDFLTGDAFPTSSPDQEIQDISISEQIEILKPLMNGKKIGAGTVAELTAQIRELCYSNGLFQRDKITGLFKTCFSRRPLISEPEAETMFETHFIDKLVIKTIGYEKDKVTGETSQKINYKPVSRSNLDLIWRNIKMYSVFNSRKEFYDTIPQWDGTPRIATFMKDYYECDANPNFFLLLMTSIIGKIVNPEKNYCPYFFDIVCNSKGIGKSLLCRRLLGNKYCGFLPMTSRKDDFYVNAYDGNNIIVVDDECTWIGKGYDKISYDEFKNLVTNPVDKFSRKYQQPEEHDRCFVIIRTSNSVNTVYSTNERRQIIFESHLKEQECRIKDLPNEFFEQLLAEAKEYYEQHGLYALTDDDWKDVKDTNLENFNWETEENFIILDFIKDARSDEKYRTQLAAHKFNGDKWSNYKKYVDWCSDNKKKPVINRAFWRAVSAMAELPENHITVVSDTKYEVKEGGKSRVFRIDPLQTAEPADDLPDIPY